MCEINNYNLDNFFKTTITFSFIYLHVLEENQLIYCFP